MKEKIKKTALKDAILEAKEIEMSVMDSAKKSIEESINSKLEKIIQDSINEIEKENINEDIKINVGDSDIEVKTDEEGTSVEIKTSGTESKEVDVEDIETEEIPELSDETPEEETEELENSDEINAEEEEEEIFEIVSENEMGQESETEIATETPNEDKMESILNKLDVILDKIGGAEKETEGEGEIQIVDDEEVPSETPAEEATVEEVPAEGVPTEAPAEEEEDVITEDDLVEIEFDEKEEEIDTLEEIEIVDEDEETVEITDDEIDEIKMLGQSNTVQRTAGTSAGPSDAVQNRGRKGFTNENTEVHNESKLDELTKENESLKKTIQEYKESFVILRKQINEVQAFNAKLAYANKLFANGGLTNDEKIQIAEEFDKVGTIEEAKQLYNKLLKEGKFSKNTVNESIDKKMKSVKPAIAPSQSNILYESAEMKRMKEIAGIKSTK